ncbi:MAG TPA: signal peptidase II [Thermodesulfobacteriota bacterium]|nr:signal peptidase II [Thermodesulfobacteriota bacterium]
MLARRYRILLGVAAVVVAADLATKAVVEATIPVGGAVAVVDGMVSLVHARNTGAAFSLLAGLPAAVRLPFFVLVSVGAIAAVVVFARGLADRQWGLATALALVLGGAVGNLVDRLRYGEVVDFVLVYWRDWAWPAFNVADSAITVGVGILVGAMLAGRLGQRER